MSALLRFGQSVRRFEDARLLTGQGRFVDDLRVPGEAFLAILRSPYAAARIASIDASGAGRSAGVLAVLTGADLASLGNFSNRVRRAGADGAPMFEPPRGVMARDRVRFVGEAVAAVVAETLPQARDALERIDVAYEPTRAVASIEAARAPGAPLLWPQAAGNVSFVYCAGDREGAERALAGAAHVVEVEMRVNRVTACAIEPRAAIAEWDEASGRATLHVTTQTPHSTRAELARILGIAEDRLRVVAPDVGGGFGMKSADYADYVVALAAARRLGRPVRWTAERSESFLADHHARDNRWVVRLGFDAGLALVAAHAKSQANLGAYLAYAGTHQATNNVGSFAGVYATGRLCVEVEGVYTNTGSVSPYRGAGRPEAAYALERSLDVAAQRLGADRIELRRRMLVRPSQMPWNTGLVFTYDSGDFPAAFERVLELSRWHEFPARQAEAAARARWRGIGFAYAIEIAGGPVDKPFEEHADVRVDAAARATLRLGTHSHGQGHETAFRQIASEALGLPAERIDVLFGDTDVVAEGKGTFGSRSMSSGGTALVASIGKVVAQARAVAARLLEAAEVDVELRDGCFVVKGTDREMAWERVAAEAGRLEAASKLSTRGPTFPNSAHVCEVELDPETGALSVVGYWIVDDVGRVVNPMLLHGQIQGGVAQGLGQVLCEDLRYDADGQLVTASFMDYALPRASDIPAVGIESLPVSTAMNPLGVKGAGEAGAVGALPAAANAIVDALGRCGVSHFDMPATPERIWRTIHASARERT